MTRRDLLAWLAALPFLGHLLERWQPEPDPVHIVVPRDYPTLDAALRASVGQRNVYITILHSIHPGYRPNTPRFGT